MTKTKKTRKRKVTRRVSSSRPPEREKGGRGMYAVINGNTKEEVTDLVNSMLDYSLEQGLEQVEVMSIQPSPAGGWEAIVRAHNWNPIKWAAGKASGAVKTISRSEAGELTKRGFGKVKDVEKRVEGVAKRPVRFFTQPKKEVVTGSELSTSEDAEEMRKRDAKSRAKKADEARKQVEKTFGSRKDLWEYTRSVYPGGPDQFDYLSPDKKLEEVKKVSERLHPETAKQVIKSTIKGQRLKERTSAQLHELGLPSKSEEYYKDYEIGHYIDLATGKSVPAGTPGAEYIPGHHVMRKIEKDIPLYQQVGMINEIKRLQRQERNEAFRRKVEPISNVINTAERLTTAATEIHPAARRGLGGGSTPIGVRGGSDLYRVPIIPPVALPDSSGVDLSPLRKGIGLAHLRDAAMPRIRRDKKVI